MILIGQYDSPFVRRVGVAMHLYGIDYEHRPWSVFGDADRLRAINPLCRVPTLIAADGTVLMDSATILDHLDDLAGATRALLPATGVARMHARRRRAMAVGVCEKAVALVYEHAAHDPPSATVVARCRRQIADTLSALEAECGVSANPFWFGSSPGHDDIALACAARFVAEALHTRLKPPPTPAVAAHAARCEALPAFIAIRQTFNPPPEAGRTRD